MGLGGGKLQSGNEAGSQGVMSRKEGRCPLAQPGHEVTHAVSLLQGGFVVLDLSGADAALPGNAGTSSLRFSLSPR